MESKFKINSINLLTNWSYDLPTNTDCTICRCNLNSPSIYNIKQTDSIITIGMCSHSFHNECITPWLNKNKHCPICSANYIVKTNISPNLN